VLLVNGLFHPCFVPAFPPPPPQKSCKGHDFYHRRSLTGSDESYVLSGRSAFSKTDSGARRASLHSCFQAHAVRLYIRAIVEVGRIFFHSASKKI
jgi:hypothetical protein